MSKYNVNKSVQLYCKRSKSHDNIINRLKVNRVNISSQQKKIPLFI